MRIVITGASGFLGSWACRVLSAQHEVVALVRETSNTYRISNLRDIQVIRLPIRLWPDQIMNINPDVLVMSDWSGVSGIERNAELQRDNFNLHTSHVLPALIRKFVEATTSSAESVTLWGNKLRLSSNLFAGCHFS
jgi:hypothetical protein